MFPIREQNMYTVFVCVWLRECKHTDLFHSLGRKTEESLKASCFQDWLCVYVKRKKKSFYFNSENQRGYLTDFPFVLLIVMMKPKKPKIFFVLFSTVCAQLQYLFSHFLMMVTRLFSLLLSPFLCLPLSLFPPCSLLALHCLLSSKGGSVKEEVAGVAKGGWCCVSGYRQKYMVLNYWGKRVGE